ncbi:hypothetical protein M5J15_15310 [Serratia symbiotica]|uniref:hypothetical protein n=1 Tax=Serratia symbiotica TaxID=138074 RepID=UPI001DBB5EC6|nr:hypothetical protein [Serratia symbiotica]NIG88291.1 hypothetical protein [Serratia symbiotica]USS95643.1 hypothetical protein M5J15_15310 [Serratia symbiotica]
MNKFSKLLDSALLAGTAFSAAAYVQAAPAPIQCQDDEIAVNVAGKWVCVNVK